MKTKNSFSSSLSFALSMILSSSLIGGPSLSLAASETVKTSTTTPRGKQNPALENGPTPEEVKMGAVKTPYKACDGTVIVELGDRPTGSVRGARTPAQIEWDKKKDFWAKYPGEGCDASKVNCTRKVQYIPDTHFYKSFDGTPRATLSGKESANDFLKRVAAESIAKVKARIEELKKQKACLEAGTGDCMKGYLDRMAVLKSKIPEFRLSVARYNDISNSFFEKGPTMPRNAEIIVTKDFSSAEEMMVVPKNMPALSKDERGTLLKEMNALFDAGYKEHDAEIDRQIKDGGLNKAQADNFRKVATAPGSPNNFLKPRLDAQKEQSLATYNGLLAQYPELGYVNESDLDPKKMPARLAEAIKDAEGTMADMKKNSDAVSSTPGAVDKKRLQFAAHSRTIEEMLAKEGDGRSCAIAAATLNELGTVRTKDGLVLGGVSLLASLTLGVAGGMAARTAGVAIAAGEVAGGMTVAGHALGAMAFAAGAGPGLYESYHSIQDIDNQARDARVGIVKPEEANKALEGKMGTIVMSALNFQGAGHFVGAVAGATIGTSGVLTKFFVANALKDAGKGGGAAGLKATEQLATSVTKAAAGDAVATKAVVAAAAAQEKAVLGTVAEADRATLGRVVAAGVAGTAENPDPTVLKAVADNLAGLKGDAKVKYADTVVELRGSVAPSKGNAARDSAANHAIADVADVVPTSEAKKILADPAWDAQALTGWSAVAAKMRQMKGNAKEKFLAAWESLRVKAGLAKEKTEDVLQRGVCGGFIPKAGIAGLYDGNPFGATEPKFMACAEPLNPTL